MKRWWFILLAVVLGWFTPAHAFAHTRAVAYDAGSSMEKVVLVAGITMDTHQGDNHDPLSLHKYLYCEGNPANRFDPSGHDDLVDLMVSMSIDAGLSSMVSAAVQYGGQRAIASIIPDWVIQGFGHATDPDAVLVGTSLSLNIEGKGIGFSGGGGIEGLWSPHTMNSAVFGFGGGGLSFGTTKGAGSIQFYAGAVYDCLDAEAYRGPFFVASMPYSSALMPAKIRNSINGLANRASNCIIDWLRGGKDDAASAILHKTFAPSSVLDKSSVNLFWNADGGAYGWSFGYGIAEPGTTSNVTLGVYDYAQISPDNDQNVSFK